MIGNDASFLLSFPFHYFSRGSQNKAPLQFPLHTATCQWVHVATQSYPPHTHTRYQSTSLMPLCLSLSHILSRLPALWPLETVSAQQFSPRSQKCCGNKSHGLISPGFMSGMSLLVFSKSKHWTLIWLNYWGKLDVAEAVREGGQNVLLGSHFNLQIRRPIQGKVHPTLQNSINRWNLSRPTCFDGGQRKITNDNGFCKSGCGGIDAIFCKSGNGASKSYKQRCMSYIKLCMWSGGGKGLWSAVNSNVTWWR